MSTPKNPIEINNRFYVQSHGAAPKGRGSWAFFVTDNGKDIGGPAIFTPSMTFSDARVWIKAHVRANFAAEIATGCFGLNVGS